MSEKALPGFDNEVKQRQLPELSWPPKGPMPGTAQLSSADGPVGGMISTHRFYRQVLAGLRF